MKNAPAVAVLTLCSLPLAPCAAQGGASWEGAEQRALRGHIALTTADEFTKAGEAYFSPDASWIIFQAVPAGEPEDSHYSMYVAKLERDAQGSVTGIGRPLRVSEPGSANTCGWFHPNAPQTVIFGSTIEPFTTEESAGYQRESSDYAWLFPGSMEVTSRTIPEIFYDRLPEGAQRPVVVWGEDAERAVPIWERDGYDAECAYSPDGRYIVHTQVDPGTGDGDIYIFDTRTGEQHPIVVAPGYDGGPFFSPDGQRICYRSDRRGNDELQLFVADLAFDDAGVPSLAKERAITDNAHVNWAPYWDPTGSFLVYTTSEEGHHNYEVFSIEVPAQDAPDIGVSELANRRITTARGFDGMPVISNDGTLMMWTSQRSEGGASQVWIAEVVDLAP